MKNKSPDVIWLASYPRSGNTLLRTILWHCFGLRSASVYPDDLGGRQELENYVGHIEHDADGQITFPPGALPLLKTHEPPRDDSPALYVVRDARAASVSLWQFYQQALPLDAVIAGRHRFGTWSAHLAAWKPWERPDTLLIRYEDLVGNLPPVLARISTFLGKDILKQQIPARESVASVDGRWVRSHSDWRSQLPADLLAQCNDLNRELLQQLGYLAAGA